MKIKPIIGWVVCESTRGGKRAKMVCPHENPVPPYEYDALCGLAEIYYSKRGAMRIAEQLNKNWETDFPVFIVKKAKLEVLE